MLNEEIMQRKNHVSCKKEYNGFGEKTSVIGQQVLVLRHVTLNTHKTIRNYKVVTLSHFYSLRPIFDLIILKIINVGA